MVHTFFRQILSTSKLTKLYWTLTYINGNFSVTQLLTMVYGPLYWDTVYM